MRRAGWVAMILAALGAPLAAQSPVAVTAEVSQTSLWPGDRIHYLVKVVAPADVRLAVQDFDPASLDLEPFDILDLRQQSRELTGGLIEYSFDYLLVHYEIGDRQLDIPGFIFRYEGAGADGAGRRTRESRVPPFPLSLRTTLNRPIDDLWIRESLPLLPVPGWASWAVLAGVMGLVASSLPLGGWVWRRLPDWQARRRRLGRKQFLREWSRSLAAVEQSAADAPAEVKQSFESLEKLARDYVLFFWEIEPWGLTHQELASRLNQNADAAARAVGRALEHGEHCRYGADDDERWRQVLREDLEELKKLAV